MTQNTGEREVMDYIKKLKHYKPGVAQRVPGS